MNEDDVKFLELHGWEVECKSPFEIRTKDGSFASGEAADIVLRFLRDESDLPDDPSEPLMAP